jgi:acyl carrier protein
MNDVVNQLTAMISRLGGIGAVAPDDDFYAAGFSSVTALELLVELESAFDVTIPDDDFIGARSVGALAVVIKNRRETGPQ